MDCHEVLGLSVWGVLCVIMARYVDQCERVLQYCRVVWRVDSNYITRCGRMRCLIEQC